MDNRAADLLDMEVRVAMLLKGALELPAGPERDSLLEEIKEFSARLSALKAKGK
jgi:hypothetical protein